MKVSDYVAGMLKKEGIRAVFGFQGSNITHIIDSVAKTGGIEYIQNHHEQASAFAANAYAEVSGGLGCAVSSSGPGAINMIGGIVNAWFDSVPVLFITGQLNSKTLRADKSLRQHGFQEFDIVSVAKGFTKYAVTVPDPGEIRFHLEKALFLARDGRPGPVLLDLPHNVQNADADIGPARGFSPEKAGAETVPAKDSVSRAFELLKAAKKPLLLLGGGARGLECKALLKELTGRLDLPYVASLRGLDALPHGGGRFFGFIGSYGNRYANLAVAECDFLLTLGSRLDMRQTGDFPEEFAKKAVVVRVDIDERELSHYIEPDIAARCDCAEFVRRLLELSAGYTKKNSLWTEELRSLEMKYPVFSDGDAKTLPNAVIRAASLALSEGDIITGDVGQNQMWTAQSIRLKENMRFVSSGGLGSMGFALPAAVGALFASPGSKALAVTGDGGIQMNMQELGVIAREKLPVKILLMNNRSLGLIRTYQEIVFKNSVGSVKGFSSPDYRLTAESYGIPYISVRTAADIEAAGPLLRGNNPLFAEVELEPDTEIHPGPVYMEPVYVQEP